MNKVWDVIVVGLGAMGASSLRALARAGASVLGLDARTPPHAFGSTHGESRVTRVAVGEGDVYVPLARRSHEVWRELETGGAPALLEPCGMLTIDTAPRGGALHGVSGFFDQVLAIAERYGVPHQRLDGVEIRRRFPALAAPDEARGYFEPGAGFVRVEAALSALLADARAQRATTLFGERYLGHRADGDGVEVITDAGRHRAGMVVLAAGPWMPGLVPIPGLRLLRQVLHWFAAEPPEAFTPAVLPVFLWLHGPGSEDVFYGFPELAPGAGVKVATEQFGEACLDPDRVERGVGEAEVAEFARRLRGRVLGLTRPLRSVVCLYTQAADGHFIIDRGPSDERAIVISACSGHGFKHAPAVGEIVARMALEGADGPAEFSIARPGLRAGASA